VPVRVGLAQHARDQIDVDLRKAEAPRLTKDTMDLRRAVRPPVDLENAIVEVLDAQAQARDAEAANDLQLLLTERARLALERDLGRAAPIRSPREPRHETFEL
jgi:hypothetical protein